MTKVTILGQDEPKKKLEKIKTEYTLDELAVWVEDDTDISAWENCMLIERKAYKNLDLFIAWDNDSKDKYIFLGHFNDGIV